MHNSQLFKMLIESDPRVSPPLCFLKAEIRALGLIRPKENYFSSYAYITMMLAVLTDLSVVPRLRQGFETLPSQ